MKKYEINFKSISGNEYKINFSSIPKGTYKINMHLNAEKHDPGKYFLYQNLKKNTQKRTFSNMNFSSDPPGEKFGPWPGWRFVPEMPKIFIIIANKSYNVKYYFTGDEETTKKLHAFASIDICHKNEKAILQIQSNEIFPENISLIASPKIELSKIDLKIKTDKLNTYPRLLFNRNELEEIRKNYSANRKWKEILKLLKNRKLEWKITAETRVYPGNERLNIIDKMVLAAYKSIITREKNDIKTAIDTFREYVVISSKDDYEPMKIDTQTGECIYNMCLTYDWLFNFLTEEEREYFKKYIKESVNKLNMFLNPERDDFAQAHFLGCISGLLAYSITFYDEKESLKNIKFIAGAFQTAMNMLPDDGAYPHGINLWIYEYSFLVRITELLFRFTNRNHWKRKKFWNNSSGFRNYAASFDGSMGITFGDPQFRVGGDAWIHYLISLRTGNEDSLSFAERICNLPVEGVDFRSVPPRRRIFEMIYSPWDESVQPQYTKFFNLYKDTGQFFIKDTEKKIFITGKAGPPLGKKRYAEGELGGYGHSDPCNGSFMILKNDKLIICAPESTYKRCTENQNTITFNSYGQYGDKMVWAPDFYPEEKFARILSFNVEPKEITISMDLSKCYLDFLEIKKFHRKISLLDSSILIIIDEIELKKEYRIEWNLHYYGSMFFNPESEIFRISSDDEIIYLRLLGMFREKNSTEITSPVLYENNKLKNPEFGKTGFVPGYPNAGKQDKFMRFFQNGKKGAFVSVFILNDEYLNHDISECL
jgi:hypothetical protein